MRSHMMYIGGFLMTDVCMALIERRALMRKEGVIKHHHLYVLRLWRCKISFRCLHTSYPSLLAKMRY